VNLQACYVEDQQAKSFHFRWARIFNSTWIQCKNKAVKNGVNEVVFSKDSKIIKLSLIMRKLNFTTIKIVFVTQRV